jgi:calcineurin-like phosphoesterase family protein
MIFFTSDTHYGHQSIIRFCHRPFSSTTDMDITMIDNWNKVVSKNDTVYHIGDFSFHRNSAVNEEILSTLNGNKILIRGNHDHNQVARMKGWKEVHQYYELKIQGYRFVLFHYPIGSWNASYHGSFHLHGHSHGSYESETWGNGHHKLRLDVGVDSNQFIPWSMDEVIHHMQQLQQVNKEISVGNSINIKKI